MQDAAAGHADTVHVEKRLSPKIGYNEFIRPILSDNCFYCHGPDKNHRKAELRLDDPRRPSKKGDRAGQAGRKRADGPHLCMSDDERMPPPKRTST